MSQVVTFEDYTPPARFDTIAWSEALIEESDTTVYDPTTTVWTLIDTIDLSTNGAGLDADPTNPASRNFTTANASSLADLWYRITFVDGSGNLSLPSSPIQNTGIGPYASYQDLFRILRVNNPTPAQIEAAQDDLETATLEINAEIDWSPTHPPATAQEIDLMKNVCLNRAADLWRHRESAPGILSAIDETISATPGRYSFARYVAMLSPLKDQWGVA